MTRLPATAARRDFSDTLNRVAYGKERLLLVRRGKGLAALVPVEDLELIEKLEDEIDLREARRLLRDPRQKPLPLDEALSRPRRR